MAALTVPLLFIIVGALIWGLLGGKIAEGGRMLCLAGLIAVAILWSTRVVHLP